VDPEDSNVSTAISSVSQTDAFNHVQPPKQVSTWSQGIHALVQTNDKDLFNFDLEVMPILEVLADKTIEQAIIEMRENKEVENINEFRRNVRELRKKRQDEILELEQHETFL